IPARDYLGGLIKSLNVQQLINARNHIILNFETRFRKYIELILAETITMISVGGMQVDQSSKQLVVPSVPADYLEAYKKRDRTKKQYLLKKWSSKVCQKDDDGKDSLVTLCRNWILSIAGAVPTEYNLKCNPTAFLPILYIMLIKSEKYNNVKG